MYAFPYHDQCLSTTHVNNTPKLSPTFTLMELMETQKRGVSNFQFWKTGGLEVKATLSTLVSLIDYILATQQLVKLVKMGGGEHSSLQCVQIKDLRGNPKPRVSPDRTGPDRNRSGVGEHFKEYFRVGSGRVGEFYFGSIRVGEFYLGSVRVGVSFLPGYETFSPGILGINLPFIPKLRK